MKLSNELLYKVADIYAVLYVGLYLYNPRTAFIYVFYKRIYVRMLSYFSFQVVNISFTLAVNYFAVNFQLQGTYEFSNNVDSGVYL